MKISDQLKSLVDQGGSKGICESLLEICPKTDKPTSEEKDACDNCLFHLKNKNLFLERIETLRILGD